MRTYLTLLSCVFEGDGLIMVSTVDLSNFYLACKTKLVRSEKQNGKIKQIHKLTRDGQSIGNAASFTVSVLQPVFTLEQPLVCVLCY